MSIDYFVQENALTVPPSYSCRTVAKRVVDWDGMASTINSMNPTIPVEAARSTLMAFKDAVQEEILNGGWVKLDGFVSIQPTININLPVATDPVAGSNVSISAKISVPFRDSIRSNASLNRAGYMEKSPGIVDVYTQDGAHNFVATGIGITVAGTDIGFDTADAAQGIVLTSSAASEAQTNVAMVKPSKVIFIADTPALTSPNDTEMTLSITSRYTPNGSLRTSNYGKYVRTTNMVTNANRGILVPFGESARVSIAAGQTLTNLGLWFRARIRADSVVVIAVANFDGVYGDEIEVRQNGAYTVEDPTGVIVVNLSVSDYMNLYTDLLARQRQMVDRTFVVTTP